MSTAIETWSRPFSPAERPPYNTLAALTPALTLLTLVGGIVCGHVALSQIRRSGERGAWLAVLSLVCAYAFLAVIALIALGTLALALWAASQY